MIRNDLQSSTQADSLLRNGRQKAKTVVMDSDGKTNAINI